MNVRCIGWNEVGQNSLKGIGHCIFRLVSDSDWWNKLMQLCYLLNAGYNGWLLWYFQGKAADGADAGFHVSSLF